MKEADIFEECIFDWEPIMELVLKGIFEGVGTLESFAILDVPDQVISKVTRIAMAAEKIGIKIALVDKVIGDICARRDHFILSQKEEQVETRLAELQEEVGKVQ